MAIPLRSGGIRFNSRWPSSIWPRSGTRIPAIIIRVLDLPQPDGPTIATLSPDLTRKLKSETAGIPLKDLCREVKISSLIAPGPVLFEDVLEAIESFRCRQIEYAWDP